MILLDTHIWWWAITEPDRLSPRTRTLIEDADETERTIASISLWEFAMMATKNKIHLEISPKDWLRHALYTVGTRVLELTEEIALASCTLPDDFHKDPADRIIVATARIHNALLLTKDEKILGYPHVNALW